MGRVKPTSTWCALVTDRVIGLANWLQGEEYDLLRYRILIKHLCLLGKWYSATERAFDPTCLVGTKPTPNLTGLSQS